MIGDARQWFAIALCLGATCVAAMSAHARSPTDSEGSAVSDGADRAPNGSRTEAPVGYRLYADAFAVWIYKEPRKSRVPLGYLRGGQSVKLRAPQPVLGETCPGGWYAIEPVGFVCHESGVSFDPTRYNRAMQTLAPRPGAFPFHYAVSIGAIAYRRLPTRSDLSTLKSLTPTTATLPESDPSMFGTHLEASALPWFLDAGGSVAREHETRLVRREVPPATLLSLVSRFDFEGASYYQVADGTIVSAERLRLLRPSAFSGVWLTEPSSLPMAWPRSSTTTYRLTEPCRIKLASDFAPHTSGRLSPPVRVKSACFEAQGAWLEAKRPVMLSGQRAVVEGRTLVETREGEWVQENNLHLATVETPHHALAHARDKWIHFSIQRGTLVAYEGLTPVFATLASPGNGQMNGKGKPRLTPKGTFRINFKHLADDMSGEEGEHRSEWKADVPYAMYFSHPYGIHVSYWHDDFGTPKSGGCINVSPEDGARLFAWTDPPLPSGWFGVGSSKEWGLGTIVFVTA